MTLCINLMKRKKFKKLMKTMHRCVMLPYDVVVRSTKYYLMPHRPLNHFSNIFHTWSTFLHQFAVKLTKNPLINPNIKLILSYISYRLIFISRLKGQ